jgi:hypothetical protein
MTTARSPLRKLQAQADRMAYVLKATARGQQVEVVGQRPFVRQPDNPMVKFMIAIDDKVTTIEMAWAHIDNTSETALSAFILKEMRGKRESVH